VAQDQKLIEKHGQKRACRSRSTGSSCRAANAVNDALLSGSIDVAGAGVGPLLTIWDRTKGRQNVKGVASLGNFPYYLVSTNPNVKTIADFSDKDRIALPAVTVSVQARILQMAAAKQWGTASSRARPPDAGRAASGRRRRHHRRPHRDQRPLRDAAVPGTGTGRQSEAAHVVLNSYDVQGGPSSSTVLYATEKYVKENPKTYRAFIDALDEAAQLIATKSGTGGRRLPARDQGQDRPRAAAEGDQESADPVQGGAAEHAGPGAIPVPGRRHQEQPASWRDYFFEHPALASGS
jgi:NitT/TauT family transport system substrate-binding protein